MAKKFVRGVTGIEDIQSYDKTLTNVNDILSDGQDTYVHTKKGKTESYYKLTDSLKSVISDNSELITVTKDDTTNTATLHPKHDAQKEQSLESTRGTVTIKKGTNGTTETTKIDTNPQKVLEHDNLLTSYGIGKYYNNNQTTIMMDTQSVPDGFNLNDLSSGLVRASYFTNSPIDKVPFYVVALGTTAGSVCQIAFKRLNSSSEYNEVYQRNKLVGSGIWTEWARVGTDDRQLQNWLAQKQNTITNNTSIGVNGSGLQQLYSQRQLYAVTGKGLLKTHVKSVAQNTSVSTNEEEFNFIVKINQGASSVNFTLNSHDSTKFQNIITTYGADNAVNINGCVFTLNGFNLTVSTSNNTAQNYVITFSDII